MIADLVTAGAVQMGGVAFTLAAGVRQSRLLIPLGFVAGLSLLILVSAAQAITVHRIFPILSLAIVAVAPLVWLVLRLRRGGASRRDLLGATLSVPAAMAVAALLSIQGRVNVHADSFEYLTIGSLLVSGGFDESLSLFQLEKRLVAVGAMHAPAALTGDLFLPTITPLLALSCLLLVAGFVTEGIREQLGRGSAVAIGAGAALVLLSLNRFVWNAFYINGHLLFATFLLVLVAGSWLAAKHRKSGLEAQLLPVQMLAAGAIVLTRPDAGIMTLVALAPTLLDPGRRTRDRVLLAVAIGAVVVVWQVFVILVTVDRGGEVTRSMVGLLALGLVVCAGSWLLRFRWLTGNRRGWLWVGEIALWLALAMLTLRDHEILTKSLDAAFVNILLGHGGWGLTFDILALCVLAVVTLLRDPGRLPLRFAVTTFAPVVFLLAYLREGAYRVGFADSLNRMAIQIVPLAVVLLATAATSAWAWHRRDAGPEIIFITRKFPPSRGGMETAAFELSRALQQQSAAEIVALGWSRRWTPVAVPVLLLRGWARALRSGAATIVVQDGVLAPLGVLLGRLTRRPVAVIIHGLEITHPAALHQRLMRWSLPRVQRLVAVSENSARLIRYHYPGIEPEVVRNGVADVFRSPLGRDEDRRLLARLAGLAEDRLQSARILVTVGRLVPRKGVAWFVAEVMPALRAQPGVDTVYLVVGEGRERGTIEEAIARTGLESAVRLLGEISADELRSAFTGADLFVMPNLPMAGDVEGFGLVAVEASSTGTPVVAADVDGIPDAVRDGGNGVLVPAGDAAAFATAIRDADTSPEARLRVRDFTLREFSWTAAAIRLRMVAAELGGRRPAPMPTSSAVHSERQDLE